MVIWINIETCIEIMGFQKILETAKYVTIFFKKIVSIFLASDERLNNIPHVTAVYTCSMYDLYNDLMYGRTSVNILNIL